MNRITIFFWLATFASMMYVRLPWTYPLFIILVFLTFLPVRSYIWTWCRKEWKYSTLWLGFAGSYFLCHAPDILRLELWSDEILSLKIASGFFYEVAGKAMTLGAIPPYHYWELWYWQNLIGFTGPEFTEFVYRMLPMAHHTAGAILFSWVVHRIYSSNSPRSYIPDVCIRSAGFAVYFFHPLLFPYALEVRPYALMATGSVVLLAGSLSKEVERSDAFIPVRLWLCMTSFFHIILYSSEVVRSLFLRISIKTVYLTTGALVILVVLLAPYYRAPYQTTAQISMLEIIRTQKAMISVFAPNLWSGVLTVLVFIGSIGVSRLRRNIVQAVVVYAAITVLAYFVQYQAFAPRHYIVIFPMILLMMFSYVFYKQKSIQYVGFAVVIIFMCIWIRKTENMVITHAFAPKIHIGIKNALLSSLQHDSILILEKATDDRAAPDFYTQAYYEEQSLWYIGRYQIPKHVLKPKNSLCQSVVSQKYYIIAYGYQPCFQNQRAVTVLNMVIREP